MGSGWMVPSLIFGPGKLDQAHAVDEHIAMDDLVVATKAYALLLEEWSRRPQQQEGG